MAGISYGITLASTMAGDTAFMSEPVRQALLAAVDATLAELDAAANWRSTGRVGLAPVAADLSG